MFGHSSSNDSLHQPNISFINSYGPLNFNCIFNSPGSFVFLTFCITHSFLLLPLCILVLHLGFQQWRKQRSTSTAAMTSHSDIFTYHMVTMELMGVLGYILSCCGIFRHHVMSIWAGFHLWSMNWYGEIFFHILTCVERYLAVVHPIIYLSLKGERGVRIRNIIIGCVWLLSIGVTTLVYLAIVSSILNICLCIFSLVIISLCNLSVLCVLIHPGPGEQGGNRERVDQSKKRSFYTIMAILGVLLLRFFWNIVWIYFEFRSGGTQCVTALSDFWFNVPSSLVIPLLFLRRKYS